MNATATEPRVAPVSADAALPPAPGATGPMVVPPPVRRRRPLVLGIVIVIVAISAGIAVPMLIAAAHLESTDDAFIDADVVRAAPRVAGQVLSVPVQDNQLVEPGQVLVQIDPRDFEIKVRDSQAGLAEAEGKLAQQKAQLAVATADADQADAQVEVAQANATNAAEDLHRYTTLEARAISQQMKDAATASARGTTAALTASRRKAASAHAQVDLASTLITTAAATVETARAKVDQANLDLSYTQLRAPVAGRVTRKSVHAGNYIQVGQQVLALVPTDVYVTANFKETQLERMRKDQPVDIEVDAYPHHPFHGHVDSLQAGTGAAFSLLPPENATGNYVKVVQRVPVKIQIDDKFDPAFPLAPGMSVEPDVRVK